MMDEGYIKARGWSVFMIDPDNHTLAVDVRTVTRFEIVPGQFPQLSTECLTSLVNDCAMGFCRVRWAFVDVGCLRSLMRFVHT